MNEEFTGKVIKGKGNGRAFLVTTFNLDYDKCNTLEYGVYISVVEIDGKKYVGVTNVGKRPTIDNDDRETIETHILDFDENIYGKVVKLCIKEKIRNTKKFLSVGDLKKQIEKDILVAKEKGKNYV